MDDVEESPSSNGTNGRDDSGRFAPGNKLGKGGPFAGKVMALKASALECVTGDQVADIMGKLYSLGMEGDVAACKAFLDRLFGKEIVAKIEASDEEGSGGIFVYLPGNKR